MYIWIHTSVHIDTNKISIHTFCQDNIRNANPGHATSFNFDIDNFAYRIIIRKFNWATAKAPNFNSLS